MTTDAAQLIERRIRESVAVQERLLGDEAIAAMVSAAELISATLQRGGKLLAFGNGGSASDADHLTGELIGRFQLERRGLPALSLSDNPSAFTAIANDYGYDRVFARQVEALGAEGDVALGISTSGTSANVLAAFEAARAGGLSTIGLTGGDGGGVRVAADVCIVVPSDETPRIQEGHTLVAHVLCELVEQAIAGG
jgi:D-sedoheptulose 7-phosphate isomerase